ncbi:endonuclease/exonuclease/phosphatase family protein [Streptomyces olivaceoviridis]|uniref:endonuclease/exonuclease/phosphatase family protein n=2 Tax=Streptomyces olivaceoviridis TaxID=1921 RepID=UPI0036AC7603
MSAMGGGKARPRSGIFRVMTVNVLDRRHADWQRRRRLLERGVQDWQPDVVALQEVVRCEDYDGVRELLGEGWHVAAHPRWSEDGVGAAVASRWPITAVRTDAFGGVGREAMAAWCGVTVAEVQAPSPFGTMLVVHHKPSWERGQEREREAQAIAAARLVEAMAGSGHVVLLGDFDAPPDSASVRFWTGRQSLGGLSVCYRDAWEAAHPGEPGHTFSPVNPLVRQGEMPEEEGRRVDYIMVRCDDYGPTLRVGLCEQVFSEPVDGVWASDHYGLVADLLLPAHRPGSWALG